MKITVDLDHLNTLIKDADQILLSADGEKAIIQLLELKELVVKAEKAAKLAIEVAALKLDMNFTSVESDKIKISYRAYGPRYKIDESHIDKLPTTLYKKVVKFSPLPKAIDDHSDEHGLPLGVIENEREKQISIKEKK